MGDYLPLAPPIAAPMYRKKDGRIANVWNEYFIRYGLMINSAVDGVEIYGENVFKFAAGETVPDNTTITLTALLLGNLTVYDWEYWTGSAWTDLSGTQDEVTYTLAYDNAAWGTDTFLRVRCLSGAAYDEITILKMRDGVAGVDGGNWSSDINFVAADYNTVGWYAGSIFTAGVEFEIVQNLSGTGNMAATTASYIYLYPTVSETELQVTTSAVDAVGAGKILVCVAYPSASTSVKAQFQAFGGRGGVFINADNIAAGCITADKIVANSLTSTQINTSGLIVYSDVGGTKPPTNADNTGSNTAANSNALGGTAASTVVNNASTGATHAGTTHAPSNADQTYTAINGGIISTGSIGNAAGTMNINFGTATITVSSSTGLKVNVGGGITLIGSDSVPGKLIFDGTSYDNYIASSSTGNRLAIYPLSSSTTTLAIGHNTGFSSLPFSWIYNNCGSFKLTAYTQTEINSPIIRLYGSTSTYTNSLNGASTGTYDIGASFRYRNVYATGYYDSGGGYNDNLDDLYIMSQYQPKKEISIDPVTGKKTKGDPIISEKTGNEILDILSIPRWMTNYDDVVLRLKKDNCDLITDADITEWLEDEDEAGWMISRNIAAYNDLTSGGVRQLDVEMRELLDLAFSRITALENGGN